MNPRDFPGVPAVTTLHFPYMAAEDAASIPSRRTKIPHSHMACSAAKKKRKNKSQSQMRPQRASYREREPPPTNSLMIQTS